MVKIEKLSKHFLKFLILTEWENYFTPITEKKKSMSNWMSYF